MKPGGPPLLTHWSGVGGSGEPMLLSPGGNAIRSWVTDAFINCSALIWLFNAARTN